MTSKDKLQHLLITHLLKEGQVDKIIITRPAVSVDEEHGFLPGTLIEKMAPWVIPIMDVFKEYYNPKQIEKMIEDEQIEIAPLA
jgi:phosphate starvation-inducible protein PhoH